MGGIYAFWKRNLSQLVGFEEGANNNSISSKKVASAAAQVSVSQSFY
jgi:hypothetical protein